MEKLPISVIILTYNEEKNIEGCLKSISGWADEIFIVDSGSVDSTIAISKKYTNEIYSHAFENYGKQRNWAQENIPIKNEWIFHLDADERVTGELLEELKLIFSKPVFDVNGFLVSRRTIFMGKWIKRGGHYPAYHLRIFKKITGRCEDRMYDQHFYIKGQSRILNGDIIDVVTSDIKTWIRRLNRWAYFEAMEAVSDTNATENRVVLKGDKNGDFIKKKRWLRERYYKLPIFIRPFLYFLYRYFIKVGFLDGLEGLAFHSIQGFWYRFLVDVNIYKLRKNVNTWH